MPDSEKATPMTTERARRRAGWYRVVLAPIGLAGALGLSGVLGATGPAAAQAVESDFVRNTMIMLGLEDDSKPEIEYRERAPLVVPPNAEALPQPRESLAKSNPNWPKDPDIARRKKAAEDDKKPIIREDTGRPLLPSELNKGRRMPSSSSTASNEPAAGENQHKNLLPSELGSKGIFSKLPGQPQEKLTFTGEPERETLLQPPTGYQTPAASAPYGVVEEKKKPFQVPNLFERQDRKDNQ